MQSFIPSNIIPAVIEWLPSAFGTLGIMLSIISSAWCEWITYGTTSFAGADTTFGIWSLPIWSLDDESSSNDRLYPCVAYPHDTDMNACWKVARAATILSPILATMGLWIVFRGNLLSKEASLLIIKYRLTAIVCLLLATLFQGLTLLFLQSNSCLDNQQLKLYLGTATERECRMFWSAKTSIASIAALFVSTTILICNSSWTKVQRRRKQQQQQQDGEPLSNNNSNNTASPPQAEQEEVQKDEAVEPHPELGLKA